MKPSQSIIRTACKQLILVVALCAALESMAQQSSPNVDSSSKKHHRQLEKAMQNAWKVSWSRFYHPDTQLFYDFITSYRSGQYLALLPTPEEAAQRFPNDHGYSTGMEDCMISAGVMLTATVDRYAVTGENKLANNAKAIFNGVKLATTIHGSPGFVARGVCPSDKKSTYPSTSRDQVTHAVHGLWYYYNSPLADQATKEEIAVILSAIADRMKRNVTLENNYDFLSVDGTCEPIGLQRMWMVGGHEAARLPMIYAAAWNATGREEYHRLYREYIQEAIKQSQISVAHVSTWGLVQMQFSMELLSSMEEDKALRSAMETIMQDIVLESRKRAERAWHDGHDLDLTTVATDWREPLGGIKGNGPYRKVWYCVRQSGESALAQITAGADSFSPAQRQMLEGAILRLNYKKVSSNGIYYLQAAYWKTLRADRQ